MKKRFLTVFIIFVLLMVFTACDKHTHSYGDWKIEKEATCTETGRKYRECECGNRQYEDIPALQHNYVDGVCTVCGDIKN